MTNYYAKTEFFQNSEEFVCSWDLEATKNYPTVEETITHLSYILQENNPGTWEREEEEIQVLDLHGFTPDEFARMLVLEEEEVATLYATTWIVNTKWAEVDDENWEHPCNL
jgi:hypothetical protein